VTTISVAIETVALRTAIVYKSYRPTKL